MNSPTLFKPIRTQDDTPLLLSVMVRVVPPLSTISNSNVLDSTPKLLVFLFLLFSARRTFPSLSISLALSLSVSLVLSLSRSQTSLYEFHHPCFSVHCDSLGESVMGNVLGFEAIGGDAKI